VTLLTAVVWLTVAFGLFVGESYYWQIGPWNGAGTGGDYWKLAVVLLFVLVLQVSGRRGPRPLFPFLLLPALTGFGAAVIWLAWFDRADDTFGIEGALAYVLPVVFIMFALLGIGWTMRRWRAGRFLHADPPWVARNWVLLGIAAAIVPVQFVLLRFFDTGGMKAALYLTILQWFVLNAGLTAPSERPAPPATPEPFPPP
jgi:hypothetical protein